MKKIWLGLLLSSISIAAELVEIPEGILVRSLPAWENETLEVKVDGVVRTPVPYNGAISYVFSQNDLCNGAAYRTSKRNWVSLAHYCSVEHGKLTSFLFSADTQELHDEHELTGKFVRKIRQKNPGIRFHLIAGDLVHWGNEQEWKAFRKTAVEQYSATLPVVPVVGNHELYLDPLLSWWHWLYGTVSNMSLYYVIDYPLFSLVVLDSNVEWFTTARLRAQDRWLEETLKERQGVTPVIVTFHHPGYSSGNVQFLLPLPPKHARDRWQPLFKKYGVKAVLNGHDHIYQRLEVDGVNYLISGPAAGTFGSVWAANEHAKLIVPDERTVSLVSVNDTKAVRVQTWSARTEKLIDDVTF